LVKLHGRSGMGKTTLLRAFVADVRRADPSALIFEGRCFEREDVRFKALDDLVDSLARYLRGLSRGALDAVLPSHFHSLRSTFDSLASVPDIHGRPMNELEGVDPKEIRQQVFASLKDLLSRIADRHLTVIVIDDVQWGDLGSAAFFDHFLTPPIPPVLV